MLARMPKVTEEHRQLMRRRIQESALAVVRRKGLGSMTMGDVIKESGLSAGAIYGYYSGKDDLINALAADIIGGRFEQLDDLARRHPMPHPIDALREIAIGVPPELTSDGVIVQIWALAPVDPQINAIALDWISSITTRVAQYTSAWLRGAGVADDLAERRADILAPALIGLTQGYMIRGALDGHDAMPAYLDAMTLMAQMMPATP